MSLQDDYYDLEAYLKGKPEASMLERIWFGYCDLETHNMVKKQEISGENYLKWRSDRMKELGLMSLFSEEEKALEEAKCKTCYGSGKCDDADIGDISYNEWVCPDCKGTGYKPTNDLNLRGK